ncbi:hypothetical protein BGZ61DRAFT_528665 [Ilyonectria robusta]|uniref:uncharacterized protein n=1 Tax=Ilyonectria robusta TaxID=1079257 RepID=UPI001E8D5F5D|nr:uncharacterized protein BGZ61DRAFT_528665 [Ilyonectria robusta]KAH8733360.1 hypothetical protein BGZ61DRAFT_528665 [Ilyonectria robusta]
MPAANTKANYKTYEAQARMVRAIVAAHPEVKWNYKEIAACYGTDMTDHALNHRFRRLRAQAIVIRDGRAQGFDMKDMSTDDNFLPKTQENVDKHNIAKYFGQSTADGIQFQFRTIKKDAEQLRQVESEGGNVANCLSIGAGSSIGPSTPSKPTPSRGAGSRSGATVKRSRAAAVPTFIKRSESDDEEDDLNFSELDDTPSKRIKTTGPARGAAKSRTPSRRAATKAVATIAAGAQLESSASPPEDALTPLTDSAPAPPVCADPASIFGSVEHRHPAYDSKSQLFSTSTTFTNNGIDEFLGSSGMDDVPMYPGSNYNEFEGDGEI